MSRRWLVIGTGFVGTALVSHLQTHGEHVRSSPAPRVTAPLDSTALDLVTQATEHEALDELCSAIVQADCVVLAAGLATPDARRTAALVGANALLPGLIAVAARRAGAGRFLHLSSAAVQGRTRVLTESAAVAPFSAYSRSKALGEQVIAHLVGPPTNTVVIRAISVQGPGRTTTDALRRVAASRLSSVARPGSQPSPVSSVAELCRFVRTVGNWPEPVAPIVLQPWEGLSVADVLAAAGGRPPHRLPRAACSAAVSVGYAVSRLARGRLDGPVRRAEAMWFGQAIEATWAASAGWDAGGAARQLSALLKGDRDRLEGRLPG
jgi:dTDP-4-dehydrorhamnose reductase